MTDEEALKWVDEHFFGNLDVKIVLSKALEKQIPKEVIQGHCPSCGVELDVWNYCPRCGQALDWSDV